MTVTTPGKVIFNRVVPERFRSHLDPSKPIDSEVMSEILDRISREEPSIYKEVSHGLLKLGAKAAFTTNTSFTLEDLRSPIDKEAIVAQMKKEESAIVADKSIDETERKKRLTTLYGTYASRMPEMVFKAAMERGSNLAKMVASGARGNKSQLNSNIGADFLVGDRKGNPVAIPITSSYAQGLTPEEYFAASHGIRAGTVTGKFATQDSGYLCLAEGTMVLMADYSEKPIESVRIGDWVMGADKSGSMFPVRVTKTFDNGFRDVKEFVFERGVVKNSPVVVRATAEHKVLARMPGDEDGHFGVIPIGSGDEISLVLPIDECWTSHIGTGDAVSSPEYASLVTVADLGQIKTHDIEVDHPDHLFVLANGAIVSNSKQLSSASADLVITTPDCGSRGGILVDAFEKDNIGSVLARDAGPLKAGTILDKKAMSIIKKSGDIKKLTLRSPTTCQAEEGLCSKCAGIRERGRLPKLWDPIGLAGSSGTNEPITQGMLRCLARGTMVRMADLTIRPIESIRAGDMVLGADATGNVFPCKVLALLEQGVQTVHNMTYFVDGHRDSISIWATDTHRILQFDENSPSGYKVDIIGEMFPNDIPVRRIVDEGSSMEMFRAKAGYAWMPMEERETFDLSVDCPDELFVLANGMIVHNSKHVSGVQTSAVANQATGFPLVNALAQIPDIFPYSAAIAKVDGHVEDVSEAPQGGTNITINGEVHHVPVKMNLLPNIKKGVEVEEGDILSEGIPDPSEIVKYKGIGAGRINWMRSVENAIKAMGVTPNRRNLEVLSRAVINHVRIKEPDEASGMLPDDVVEWSSYMRRRTLPSKTTIFGIKDAKNAVGKYLAKPALHHTPGTKIRKSMLPELEEAGLDSIEVTDEEPGFEPEMVRLADNPAHKDDWMVHLSNSHVKRNLTDDLTRGNATTKTHGVHFYTPLAMGLNFGESPGGPDRY